MPKPEIVDAVRTSFGTGTGALVGFDAAEDPEAAQAEIR
jgi:hypothetical protein